ncbi:hypothetical protein Tco_0994807 [Tanacetum coccineum]
MSSMGELTFFLGLQVKQQPDGIFISQDKYVADILKKFDYWSIRTASTPIESNKPLVKDEDGEDVDVHVYRSMIGSLSRAFSDSDYGGAAWTEKSTTWGEWTKHIEIQFHFIRDCYEKRLIEVVKIHTDSNVADLLTKGFDVHNRFNFLVVIEQVAVRSGMDSKMAELTMSSPNHSTSDIEDDFSSMNILNYTSVSSDYFPASSRSSSFNSSENSTDNIIPLVFLYFYNNPCLKNVQAIYAKELPISSQDPNTPPAILTLSPILPPSLLFNP